jgi:hypothetical protein
LFALVVVVAVVGATPLRLRPMWLAALEVVVHR